MPLKPVTVAEAANAEPLYVPPASLTLTAGIAGTIAKFANPVAAT